MLEFNPGPVQIAQWSVVMRQDAIGHRVDALKDVEEARLAVPVTTFRTSTMSPSIDSTAS
jgi:hypothetical protein